MDALRTGYVYTLWRLTDIDDRSEYIVGDGWQVVHILFREVALVLA